MKTLNRNAARKHVADTAAVACTSTGVVGMNAHLHGVAYDLVLACGGKLQSGHQSMATPCQGQAEPIRNSRPPPRVGSDEA